MSEPAQPPAGPRPAEDQPVPAATDQRANRWAQRLAERRSVHRERSRLYRLAFVGAGAIVTLAGIAMLILPGPALLVIPIGLAMLAMEFAWAERLLDRALEQAERAQRTANEASRGQKIFTAAATVAGLGALVAWGLIGDIPIIPDP